MIKNYRISIYLLAFLFFLPSFFFAQIQIDSKLPLLQPNNSPEFVPNALIVKINPDYRHLCTMDDIAIAPLKAVFENYHVQHIKKLFPNVLPPSSKKNKLGQELIDLSLIYELNYDDTTNIFQIIYHLSSYTAVAYAEPWYLHEPFYQPNDPYADTLNGAPGMYHLQRIQAQEGWDIERDVEDVVVGIIDTGILFEHEDLKDNIAYNLGDPIDGIDNDGDGYVDNYRGWDLAGPLFGGLGDNNPEMTNSDHGVGVAGVLAATTDNGLGTAGVCFNCKYLPIKGSADDFSTSISHGYQGIVYAVEQGAQIVNCSWGSSIRSQLGEDVVKYATLNRQAAVVAAAGNSESDIKFYPAAYDEVISVVNMTKEDTLCCNSTYNYSVDVGAPGWNLLAPVGDGIDAYSNLFGTSYASPLAAGVVAVTQAHFPQYTGFQAGQRVRVTTDNVSDLNPNRKDKIGTGRVNLLKALSDPPKPSIRKTQELITDIDSDLRFEAGDTLNLTLDFINYLERAENLQIDISLPEEENQQYADILIGSFQAGAVPMSKQFSNRQQPFSIRLKEGIPVDLKLAIKITYTDIATGYSDFEFVEFRVNKSYLNVLENKLHTTITSKGNFGFNDFSNNQEGLGLIYKDGANTLFEGGFLVGRPTGQVSDNIRNGGNVQDHDFWPEVQTYRVHDSEKADFEAFSSFKDQGSPQPLGIRISQHTFAYNAAADENFIIFQYKVHNEGGTSLDELYAGLFADWDIADLTKNISNYDAVDKVVFAYDALGFNPHFFGMGLLSEDTLHAFATTNPSSFGYTDLEKFHAISNLPDVSTATAGVSTGGADIMHFISAGPLNIPPKDSVVFAFSILAAPNYQQLILANKAAKKKYECVILGQGPISGFSVLTPTPGAGQPTSFADNNTTATSWHWDFGDGHSSTTQNPSHIYEVPGKYTVIMTADDGICKVKKRQFVTVKLNTDLYNSIETQFRLFPNPAKNQLYLGLNHVWKGEIQIELYNLHGQKIFHRTSQKRNESWNHTIQISQFPSGIYELKISGEGLKIHRKVVRE